MATAFEIMDIKYGSCGCPLRAQEPTATLLVNIASAAENFNLHLQSSQSFNVQVDYGDGTPRVVHTGSEYTAGHTYAVAGTYTVQIYLDETKGNIELLEVLNALQVTSINVDELIGLTTLLLQEHALTSFTPSVNLPLFNINLLLNSLSVSAINALLVYLDNTGVLNGTAALQQNPAAPPSGAGLTAKTNLEAKGWVVQTD